MLADSLDTFSKFSPLHWVVLVLVVVVSITLGLWRRKLRRVGSSDLVLFDRQAAAILLTIWIIAQIIEFLPSRFTWSDSLPIHICDLTGLIAAAAVWSDRRGMRALLYYWGLGLSTQAVFQPDLSDGPTMAAFWVFWIPHASIVAAALYDLIGRGYRPDWRGFGFAYGAILLYAVLVLPIDLSLGVNYGFVGNVTGGPIDFLGPWPGRVFKVAIGVGILMAVMTAPWSILRTIARRRLPGNAEPQLGIE